MYHYRYSKPIATILETSWRSVKFKFKELSDLEYHGVRDQDAQYSLSSSF